MPGIMVGVDGSEHCRWALEWATNEAVARHAPLTVLSVRTPTAAALGDGDLDQQRAVRKAQALVDTAVSSLPGPAPPVTVRVVTGSPAAELITAGRDADLLVVGSRGHGASGRSGPGAVSSQVAYDGPCPVVIILQPFLAPARAGRR